MARLIVGVNDLATVRPELVGSGYISLYKGIRGKYMITKTGQHVIDVFENKKGDNFNV